jgi:ParB family chromosome partitioning protein
MNNLSLLENPDKISLNNSGRVTLCHLVKISDITLQKEFETLFAIIPANLEKISSRIRESGYDESQPVHVWEHGGKLILIDGHHRRLGAINAQLPEIPAYIHHFERLEEALEYALSLQTERRNLSDAELLTAIKLVDQLKLRGKGANGEKGKSAARTAKLLGIKTSKAEQLRFVEKYGTDAMKDCIKKGELTLNQAYTKIKAEKTNTSETSGQKKAERKTTGRTGAEKTVENAIMILFEAGEKSAAALLADHFLEGKKRAVFYGRLQEAICTEEE